MRPTRRQGDWALGLAASAPGWASWEKRMVANSNSVFVNDKPPGSTFSLPLLGPSGPAAEERIGPPASFERRPFQVYGPRTLDTIPQPQALPQDVREAMRVVARVYPFRVNSYVIEE